MLIPIHFYFLLSEQQEMSHTFLLSISLCICCPFTVVLLLLCFYSPFQPLQYLLYSSVYCMCWHFFCSCVLLFHLQSVLTSCISCLISLFLFLQSSSDARHTPAHLLVFDFFFLLSCLSSPFFVTVLPCSSVLSLFVLHS